jgi:hypothetical protein
MSENTDRRQSPRLSPDGLAFFKIEPDEGGTVADVSEGGVGFHLISPVSVSGARPVKFSFSFDSQNLIYGFGELAWLDETRKSGGLKFLRVPEEVLGKIRSGSGVFNLYPEYDPLATETTATMRPVTGSEMGPAGIPMGAVQTLVQEELQRAVVDENLPTPQPAATHSTVVPSPTRETVELAAREAVLATAATEIEAEPITADVVEEGFKVAPELEPMVQGLREQARAEEFDRPSAPKQPAGFAAGIKSRSGRRASEPNYDHEFGPLPTGSITIRPSAGAVPVPATDYYGHPQKDPALVQMTSQELWAGAGSATTTDFNIKSVSEREGKADRSQDHWRDPFGGPSTIGGGAKGPNYREFARPVFTEPAKSMFSPGLIRGLITVLIVGTLVAGAALAMISYRQQAGTWLINMGERLSGRAHADASPHADQTADAPDANSDAATPAANAATTNPATTNPAANEGAPAIKQDQSNAPKAAAPSNATAPVPTAAAPVNTSAVEAPTPSTTQPASTTPSQSASGTHAGWQVPAQAPAVTAAGGVGSVDNGSADVTAAEQFLHGANGASNPAEAARLFWVAVEKGNTTAEIGLADMYARGQGVPKSCDQARVLLTAAVSKGNSIASAKLLELNNTCGR